MDLKFFMEYIMHPGKIGAIAPSSRFLAEKMIETVSFDDARCIVEYGPGTGVFTKEIIRRKMEHCTYLIIEQNESFYRQLQKKYQDKPHVHVIHGSAEHIKMFLEEHNITKADYIVSGLPFASLPKEVSAAILNMTQEVLSCEGQFLTFQYTKLKLSLFQEYFKIQRIRREYRNLPPAYVVAMGAKGSH